MSTGESCCTCLTTHRKGALRGGHIPGAANVPWARAANEDGTKMRMSCARSTKERSGLSAGDDVIAYCRIGERSSHTWFVLLPPRI